MHFQLRTEGDSPMRKAGAIYLWTAIGCLPLYGLHLPLCVLAARLLGVSRIKAYLAAHINNPLTIIPLLYVEIGIGRWLFTGQWPVLKRGGLRGLVGSWDIGRDLLVGSLVLGLVLGALFAAISLVVSARWKKSHFPAHLREATSKRYVEAGVFAWEFVRGKLKHDPAPYQILQSGVLPREGRLLDLGCGRGILLSLLDTAVDLHASGEWPSDWAAPPDRLELVGIERRPRMVAAARIGTAGAAQIIEADLADVDLPRCRAAILVDVLHYLEPAVQLSLIDRVAAALEPGGLLLIREADAALGPRFWTTRFAERLCAMARGHFGQRFGYRTLDEWSALARERGLSIEANPAWGGTPYANVLIAATKKSEANP